MHSFRSRKKGDEGFTLVELLVVMVILGLLVALVGPKLFGHLGKSKLKAAKAQIELMGTAMDSFRIDMDRYPTADEGIKALRVNPGLDKWDGPYLRKEIPADPWGREYVYVYPGRHDDFDLMSYGADGAPGGEGENQDVVSWKGLD